MLRPDPPLRTGPRRYRLVAHDPDYACWNSYQKRRTLLCDSVRARSFLPDSLWNAHVSGPPTAFDHTFIRREKENGGLPTLLRRDTGRKTGAFLGSGRGILQADLHHENDRNDAVAQKPEARTAEITGRREDGHRIRSRFITTLRSCTRINRKARTWPTIMAVLRDVVNEPVGRDHAVDRRKRKQSAVDPVTGLLQLFSYMGKEILPPALSPPCISMESV